MSKHLVDIDEDALTSAKAELGTPTLRDTVNEALRLAAAPRSPRVTAALDALGSAELLDRDRVALTHLIDTSVVKRLGVPAVRAVVEPLAAVGRIARAGVGDLEVGYSARNGDEWDSLMGALDAFALIETTAEHLVRARQVQRLFATRSQRGRKIPDLLIAAAGEAHQLTVLHYDTDFDRIADVTGQRCTWVVPAGSID